MKQRGLPVVGAALILLLLGGWQLGSGAYIQAKAILAQQLLQVAWNKTTLDTDRVRPWPGADTWPVARLEVTRLDRELIVLAGASGRTLAFGPGHVTGTALPGHQGNSVISGHRDTHFEFLRHLQLGDRIRVTQSTGGVAEYYVTELLIQDQSDTWLLAPGPQQLTLLTCYPFDALASGGRGRYAVIALPIPRMPPESPLGRRSDSVGLETIRF